MSKRLDRQRHLAGFDLREIEDVVDQLQQVLAGGLNLLQIGDRSLLSVVRRFFLQQLAVEDDRIQRRPQLVAHAGEEIALGAGRRLRMTLGHPELIDERAQLLCVRSLNLVGFLEVLGAPFQLRLGAFALDADGDTIGDRRHRVLHRRREFAAREDRHDAHQLRVDEQGISGEGDHPLPARPERVVHMRVDLFSGRQLRCPLEGDHAHRQHADRHPRLRAVQLGVCAGAGLKFQHPLGVVQRPDAREAAVEVLHQRLGALLQHRAQLGPARQRQTDGGRQRCQRPLVILRLLARADLLFERCGALGRLPHLGQAADARHQQEHVFEHHPGRVLEPAPLARDEHAIHRLRPEQAAQHVIQRHDDGGGNHDAPVTIERQERQRAEHVEVRFDASAREVDQQGAHQHLGDANREAGRRLARSRGCRAPPETD